MGITEKNIVRATGVSRTDVFFNEDYIKEAKGHVATIIPQVKDK